MIVPKLHPAVHSLQATTHEIEVDSRIHALVASNQLPSSRSEDTNHAVEPAAFRQKKGKPRNNIKAALTCRDKGRNMFRQMPDRRR